MVGQIHLFQSRLTRSSLGVRDSMREIKGSGRKVCSVLFCTALHCNCDLRLRRSRCTPGELQFDLSWGLVLIYCTWLGSTGFYTRNGYLAYLEFITRHLHAHGVFGLSLDVGMVRDFRRAVFVCQEGVERVTGCFSGWALSIRSHTNVRECRIMD